MKAEGVVGLACPRVKLVETELVTQIADKSPAATGPAVAHAELQRLIGMKDREYFAVLHLNARNQATSIEVVSVGSLTASLVHPREVFKAAILANSNSVICGHNHPSGDVSPSDEDLVLMGRLRKAGELLGITVLDFLIVAGASFWSAQQSGMIDQGE